MAAPKGNTNAVKNKPWTDAIRRAIARYDAKNKNATFLNSMADQLLIDCLNKEKDAIVELTTRLDGKPAQSTELSGPDGGAIPVGINVKFC